MSKNNAILLKLLFFFLIAIVYLFIIIFLSRYIYRECIFFSPRATYIAAVINSSIIILCSFLISSRTLKWLRNYNMKILVIILVCILLMYPIVFLKSGIVIDDEYIRKTNIFGVSKEKYSYSDVVTFEVSIKHGVEYDITFNSKNKINLYSHEMIFFNYFRNEKNLQTFDELLENHGERIVYKSIYSTPQNIKSFFRKKEYYNYFNQIFNQRQET